MPVLDGYKAALFDCDGVLLDSTHAKMQAFVDALAGEPREAIDRFVDFQRSNWGVSRYKSLDWFYREVRKAPDAEAQTGAALARFGALSRQALMNCPEMPGARAYLAALAEAQIPAYVVTGGDEAEVKAVFAARGLDGLFARITGSPRTKAENIRLLISENGVGLPAMFFGDACADYDAARACDVDFTLITLRSDWGDGVAVCREAGWPIFEHLGAAVLGPSTMPAVRG